MERRGDTIPYNNNNAYEIERVNNRNDTRMARKILKYIQSTIKPNV